MKKTIVKNFTVMRRLRILRPFYGEFEKEIREEKQRNIKGKDKDSSQLGRDFWVLFKQKHPDLVTWEELRDVLNQLQKLVVPIYNRCSAILYKELLEEGKIKTKKGNERASIEYAISRIVYPEIMNVVHNSYIALGLCEKLKGSYLSRLKEIKSGKSTCPSAKSETFPIPIWIQKQNEKGGFKIWTYEDDFILDIPFPLYKYKEEQEIDRYKPWEKLTFLDSPKKKHIQLLLTTASRKRGENWNKDWGAEADIRKVMEGKYKVSKIELTKGKRVGERNYWYVSLVVNSEKVINLLDDKKTGAIDIGLQNPVVCAIHDGLNRLTIRDNDVIDFTRAELARLRSQRRGDRFRRGGHGKKHKFTPSEILQRKYDLRRKKKIEEWASRVTRFFLNNGTGLVYIEDIDARSMKEGDDYFRIFLRVNWPVKEMIKLFEKKLVENGIKVKYRNPAFSSQVCSNCGKWNSYFSFEYRKKHNFPSFICRFCKFGEDKQNPVWADYNAAKNLANPDFENIIAREVPVDIIQKYQQ